MLSGIKKKDFIKFKGIVYMVLSYESGGLYRCVIMNGSGAGNIDLYAYETLCLGELVYSYEMLDTASDLQASELVNCNDMIKELKEKIDDKDEIIQSLYDEIEARAEYTKKVIKERDDFCDEMKLMVKDHEDECDDLLEMINERIDVDNLHIILAKYLTDNWTPEETKICFFQFLDEIKKYIDNNKKEC